LARQSFASSVSRRQTHLLNILTMMKGGLGTGGCGKW
jgi:hypothetical protein